MPTILRLQGFRFFFYSNEGSEPPHVHVEKGDGECKFWLGPVRLARNHGVAPIDVRKIERLVVDYELQLLEKYHEFRGNHD